MMKRITAALLSALLCLSLFGSALAADQAVLKVSGTAGESKVTVTAEAGAVKAGVYRLCSLGVDSQTAALFDAEVKDGEALKLEIDVPELKEGQKLAVRVGDYTGAGETAKKEEPGKQPSGGGGGGGGGGAASYSVKVSKTEHGKVSVRPDSAVKDQKVTITVTPDKGYALDTLTVTDANGKTVTLTKVNDTTYTFLMPGTAVTVEATFKATGEDTGAPSFSDVTDKNYTFYADIMWAAEKGYMNGYSDGTFRPNNNTTRQALWMVLARIDGANPSDMSAARAWAMASKVSDGTNPEAAMSRQQMVTMLYRYAQLKGYKTTGGMSISSYPDAADAASYAQDALSWAIGNGIVNGTSDGKLNPTGTASRAHFAAFLHRFAGIAGL